MSINTKFVTLLAVVLCVLGVIYYFNAKQAEEIGSIDYIGDWSGDFALAAGTCSNNGSHNAWGWAYAEPIGPISLSCLNCDTNGDGVIDNSSCGNVGSDIANYGINFNSSGSVSGYAWSPAIGPISFSASEICVNVPCQESDFPDGADIESNHAATLEWIKDGLVQVTGWARALSACDFDGLHCTTNSAGEDAGGWDGWIKFDKTVITSSTSKPYYEDGGSVYNTVIETVGSEHVIDGNAWGGVLDSRPSAVIGEIRFLGTARTSFDPNTVCPSRYPVANFSANCLNGTVDAGGVCYYGENPNVTLVNSSTDPDDSVCGLSQTDIQTSVWSWDGANQASGSGKANTNINGASANPSKAITLTVTDSDAYTDDITKTIYFRQGIIADFSCCLVEGDTDCEENSDFRDCDTAYLGREIEEGGVLYLKDNGNVPDYTVPSEGASVSSRNWSYTLGDITTIADDTISIIIRPEGQITLTASDTVGLSDDKTRMLDDIFGNIIANPDFREIPF